MHINQHDNLCKCTRFSRTGLFSSAGPGRLMTYQKTAKEAQSTKAQKHKRKAQERSDRSTAANYDGIFDYPVTIAL